MEKLHITLGQGQKLFFTSDLHFGHRNVINFCDRPFSNEKEMGESLINNWNETVSENDVVFVLGDVFWFNDSRSIKKCLDKLNGKDIYIIPGNHDDFSGYHRVEDPRIHLCQDVVVAWIEAEDFENRHWDRKKYEIWMSHYPMMTWPHRENKTIQLFGHIHSKSNGRISKDGVVGLDQDLPLWKNQFDVGCDYWDYKPVEFEKIRKMVIKND